jgi:hypothetical protein
MELLLKRIARRETYTIGHLYVDGAYVCDTIEDKDMGLTQSMSQAVIRAIKRKGVTAIPTGRYRVTLDVRSPKFSQKKYEKKYGFCDGYLPRLINVPGYEGVLIHIGNTAKDTDGCILVGRNTKVGRVLESRVTFVKLYEMIRKAKGVIYITVE